MTSTDHSSQQRAVPDGSVAGPVGGGPVECAAGRDVVLLRRTFWTLFALLALIKLLIAARLTPFVDEAFYWQESRHLALGYSDLPPLTAWLIRLGETLFGHSTLAMRAPFLLLGTLLPLLMVRFASRLADQALSPELARGRGRQAGWIAGIWTLLLPLTGTLGVLALPDVPLTFAALLALVALERASTENRLSQWLWLGIALAIAGLTHYRVAMLFLAGFVFLMAFPRGRAQWKRPGLWLSLAIAAAGLVPLIVFNLQHAWSGLAFQAVDRQRWGFHINALIQPLEQALVTTPLLWLLLIGVLIAALRRSRRGAPWDLLGSSAAVFLIGYFAFGLFGDDQRFRVHWPLPGYLALIALLPLVVMEWLERGRFPEWLMRGYGAAAAALAALGGAILIVYLACAASPVGADKLAQYKAFPENFVGWNEIGALTGETLATPRFHDAVLVADNFMLAAELDFALDGERPVWSLDHPLNLKHGRAPQLAIWQRDEAGLQDFPGRPVLLVVEETASRERDKRAWLASICDRIANPVPVARLDLYHGRKRFALYAGSVPAHAGKPRPIESCRIWQDAYQAGLDAK